MGKTKEIDFGAIKEMSITRQQQEYFKLAKRANQRFRDLEGAGYKSGAVIKAKKYLGETYDREFFIQSKKLTGLELEEGLKKLEEFFTSKTATAKGIRDKTNKAIEKLRDSFEEEEHYNQFKNLLRKKNFKKSFYDFLTSKQFEMLKKYVDSDQLIEDFTIGNDEGFSIAQIEASYQEFLNSEMTFEQVAEKRRKNKGKFLQ